MQREYAIDMRTHLPSMTWRRFMVLVRGLSPNSATVAKLSAKRYMGKRDDVVALQTPEAAERAFTALFGPPAQGRPS